MSTAPLRSPDPAPAPAHAPAEDPPAATPPLLVGVPPLGEAAGDPWGEASGPYPDSVRALAMLVFEVVEGLRGIAQLGSSITLDAARQLASVRAARQEQRTVLRESAHPPMHPGAVRVDRPAAGIAEVASVVYVGRRARAVAMRMEWLHQRWRATEIAVL